MSGTEKFDAARRVATANADSFRNDDGTHTEKSEALYLIIDLATLAAWRPRPAEHECLFPEEREPNGRLILAPCLTCGVSALDALDHMKRIVAGLGAPGEMSNEGPDRDTP